MIKHVVMWNVRGETIEEKKRAAAELKARFEGLAGQIPGLTHLEVGLDFSGVSYACDAVLYSEFDSFEALSAYASHPAHLQVREDLKDVRTARYQVDYHVGEKVRPALTDEGRPRTDGFDDNRAASGERG